MTDAARAKGRFTEEQIATVRTAHVGCPKEYCLTCEWLARLEETAEQTEALRADIDAWRTGAHADETGHLHRCAKVNGTWKCAMGCAKADVAVLRAALEEEHKALVEEKVDDWPVHLTHNQRCQICSLLGISKDQT